MNPKPTLRSLPLECLLEILQYVPLPECMFLRPSCSQLKTAVNEHFRSNVNTLPVLLSARYSSESIDRYEKQFRKLTNPHRGGFEKYERITLGSTSGVSQWQMGDKKYPFPVQKNHFRDENYLIVFELDRIHQFMSFIRKYLPGITKLALLIDHDEYFDNSIIRILDVYRKSLKVLLLDRTFRSNQVISNQVLGGSTKYFFGGERFITSDDLSSEFYGSVKNLEALEELYFFPRNELLLTYDQRFPGEKFIDGMFRKLKVLHINAEFGEKSRNSENHQSEVFEKLEELGCYHLDVFEQRNAKYPQLKKCFLLADPGEFDGWIDLEQLPNLKEIRFLHWESYINEKVLEALNNLPVLEQIHFKRVFPDECFTLENYPELKNRTVKVIEIDKLGLNKLSKTKEEYVNWAIELWGLLSFFPNLEKVVVREPFIELTGSDVHNPGDFNLLFNDL